jgi:predicted nucleic acid-binding Zn ribbon protein
VEEMLASCPNCAGAFKRAVDRVALVCEDCGYVREPS